MVVMNGLDEIISSQVELALTEDIGPGDLTSLACAESKPIAAEIVAKSEGILAGLPVAGAAFRKLDETCKLTERMQDGDHFHPGEKIAGLKGDSRAILGAERTALNFLGHLSGIATLTGKFVKAIEGTGAEILDTRKTIPGLRHLEKYAVSCGGGRNHRFGLYDMVLVKDNHIVACGSVRKAVEHIRRYLQTDQYAVRFKAPSGDIEIEVEVTTPEQLREAVASGIKRIMLDNQSPEQLALLVKEARGLADDLKLEASGNVTLDNIRRLAESGVDFISIGALTHSAPASDFSLRLLS